MSIVMPTDQGIEAVDVGKVEFSKERTVFKLKINDTVEESENQEQVDGMDISKLANTLIDKFSPWIPLICIDNESIIIDKIDSEDGNSDLQVNFNNRENAHAYVTGTYAQKMATVEFFVEVQKTLNDHYLIVVDDDNFPGNIGFGITSLGLYPLITWSDTIKDEMKRFISFEQYKNNDPIINDYIKEVIDLLVAERGSEAPPYILEIYEHPEYRLITAEYKKKMEELEEKERQKANKTVSA